MLDAHDKVSSAKLQSERLAKALLQSADFRAAVEEAKRLGINLTEKLLSFALAEVFRSLLSEDFSLDLDSGAEQCVRYCSCGWFSY